MHATPLLNHLDWPGSAERQRILLVDDDPSLRRIFAQVLKRAGFDIDVAEDGDTAERLLANREYDVILSDIDMPVMTGIELLRVVRRRQLDVPVLLITGHPAIDTAVEAVEHGALSYLIKPIDAQTLLAAVRRAAHLGMLAKLKREALAYGGDPRRGDARGGDHTELQASFTRALSSLWMAYQPIVDWPHRHVYAHEALVRSREPSLPTPGALFDAAERLGQLFAVGRRIRAVVAETMHGVPEACIFVNLHPRDLLDDELYDRRAPLSAMAHRVVLEVTERATLEHVEDVRARVRALRALGFRIAVDDLGAGYAGLSSFAQLEPEVVKLDGSLISGVDVEPMKRKLVGSVVTLCRDMGLLMVAECVETQAERDTLADLGCQLFQGYLFARPGKLPTDIRIG